jgi:hypothetical protein
VNRAVATGALRALQEARRSEADRRQIAVGGARELVPLLARELRAGGDPSAVTETFTPGAAALVWVGKPDEQILRSASLARVPLVGVTDGESLPYVLDTNIVRVVPGRGLPTEEIATALARVLGPAAAGIAARLPVLRRPAVDHLIGMAARRNAMLGAKTGLPGKALPVVAINQLRLVLAIAVAGGRALDSGLWPEVLGIAGVAAGWQRLTAPLGRLPVPAAVARSGAALVGTVAVGVLARRRLA